MNILEHIRQISKKLNLKSSEKEYRYYIIVQSNKVDMILVKSNKNLVSELGYFHNADDCKMVINKYQRELLECIG